MFQMLCDDVYLGSLTRSCIYDIAKFPADQRHYKLTLINNPHVVMMLVTFFHQTSVRYCCVIATQFAQTLFRPGELGHFWSGLRAGKNRGTATTCEEVARRVIRLIKGLLWYGIFGVCRLLRVRFRTLGNGNHGRLGPDVDRRVPVQAFKAPAFDGDDIFVLEDNVRRLIQHYSVSRLEVIVSTDWCCMQKP
jgi:hypothetical protein